MPTKPLLILALSSFAIGCSGGGITTYDDTGDAVVDVPNIVVGAAVVDFGMAEDVGIRISSNISIQNTGTGALNITEVNTVKKLDKELGAVLLSLPTPRCLHQRLQPGSKP